MDILCLDFLLSEWRDFRGRWVNDRLLQPEWLEEFVLRWNLAVADPVNEEVLQKLLGLRSLLQHIVDALPARAVADEDLHALNVILTSTPHVQRLLWDGQNFQIEATPVFRDWNWVIAEIAGSFAELLVNGDIRRIKVCENEYCRCIFYDESKSRTRRYCSNAKCGNLWKLRRFRARRKTGQKSTHEKRT